MVSAIQCPTCNQPAGDGRFCRFCHSGLIEGQTHLKLASYGQRIGTYLLDVVIGVLTLVIGWLIWFAFVAPRGQTPGMNLLKIRCVNEVGVTASAGQMWLRQLVYQGLIYFLANLVTGGLAGIVGYAWAFWDKERQTLHDKMAGTYVVDGEPPAVEVVPPGLPASREAALRRRVEELQRLKDQGILTEEEFEQKRREAVEKL